MITKYLQSSGGDFNTAANMWQWVGDQLAAGLSDSIDIVVEAGGSFGVDSDIYVHGAEYHTSNDFDIRIYSALENPATLLGKFKLVEAEFQGSGKIRFQRLKMGHSYTAAADRFGGSVFRQETGSAYFCGRLESCIVVVNRNDSVEFSFCDGEIINCHLLSSGIHSQALSLRDKCFNSVYVGFTDSVGHPNTLNVLVNGKDNSDITAWNYGNGGVYNEATNGASVDPLFVGGAVLTSNSMTVAQILSKDLTPSEESPLLDSVTSTGAACAVDFDILGVSRPQGEVYDRGAYENIVAVIKTVTESIGSKGQYSTGTVTSDGLIVTLSGGSFDSDWGEGDVLTVGANSYLVESRVSSTQLLLQSWQIVTPFTAESFTLERAYSSIASWEAATSNDLVAAEQRNFGVCYEDMDPGEFGTVTVAGATTDEDYYRRLYAAVGHRHLGRFDAGAATASKFTITEPHFRMEFLRITNPIPIAGSFGDVYIIDCLGGTGRGYCTFNSILIHDWQLGTDGSLANNRYFFGMRLSSNKGCRVLNSAVVGLTKINNDGDGGGLSGIFIGGTSAEPNYIANCAVLNLYWSANYMKADGGITANANTYVYNCIGAVRKYVHDASSIQNVQPYGSLLYAEDYSCDFSATLGSHNCESSVDGYLKQHWMPGTSFKETAPYWPSSYPPANSFTGQDALDIFVNPGYGPFAGNGFYGYGFVAKGSEPYPDDFVVTGKHTNKFLYRAKPGESGTINFSNVPVFDIIAGYRYIDSNNYGPVKEFHNNDDKKIVNVRFTADDVSFDSTTKTITRVSGSFVDDGFVNGTIRVSGSSVGGNNKNYTVTDVTDKVLTVTQTMTTSSAGPNISITQIPTNIPTRELSGEFSYDVSMGTFVRVSGAAELEDIFELAGNIIQFKESAVSVDWGEYPTEPSGGEYAPDDDFPQLVAGFTKSGILCIGQKHNNSMYFNVSERGSDDQLCLSLRHDSVCAGSGLNLIDQFPSVDFSELAFDMSGEERTGNWNIGPMGAEDSPTTTSTSSSSTSTSSSSTSSSSTSTSSSSTLSSSTSSSSTSTSSSSTLSSSTSSSSTSTSSSSTSSSSTSTISNTSSTTTIISCRARVNFMPSRKESAFYRRKNDERVELMGTPCKLYRAKDGATRTVDEFDEIMITKAGYEPIPIDSFVIMESYQEERSRVGKGQATEYKDLPLTATFRFADDVRRLDLVEVPYEYAIAAGLIRCLDDSAVRPPTKTLYTRFKITNRMTRGINSDLTNKYYVVPSEEVWAV